MLQFYKIQKHFLEVSLIVWKASRLDSIVETTLAQQFSRQSDVIVPSCRVLPEFYVSVPRVEFYQFDIIVRWYRVLSGSDAIVPRV